MNLNNILNSNVDTTGAKKGSADKGVASANGELGSALEAGQNKNEFLELLNSSMDQNPKLTTEQNNMKNELLQAQLKSQNPQVDEVMNQKVQVQPQLMNAENLKTLNPETAFTQGQNLETLPNINGEATNIENLSSLSEQDASVGKNVKSDINQILFKQNKFQTQNKIANQGIVTGSTENSQKLGMVDPSQLNSSKGMIRNQALGGQDAAQQFNNVQANPDLERIHLKNALSQKNNNLNISQSYFDQNAKNKSSMAKIEDKYQHNSIFPKRPPLDENGQLLKNNFLDKEKKMMVSNSEQAGVDKALTSNINEQVKYIPTEPILNKESVEAAPRTIDFRNIDLDTNTDKIIDQITNYIARNKVDANPTMSVRVNHDDLGMIDIQIEKFQDNLNIKIGAENINGKLFFDQNSSSLIDHLRTSGIKLGDFNVDFSKSSEKDFSQSNREFSQNFGGNSRHQGGQGFQSRDEDSQRRQELWDNYLEQKDAA
ncbi:flagellar hook-length control protein FliK [Bacteriovoracaceae bacterium]|nr:flagellar hook-length control protein FliK [Bacteriovoracaceae bacterium]